MIFPSLFISKVASGREERAAALVSFSLLQLVLADHVKSTRPAANIVATTCTGARVRVRVRAGRHLTPRKRGSLTTARNSFMKTTGTVRARSALLTFTVRTVTFSRSRRDSI
jgi:hypothetical protein